MIKPLLNFILLVFSFNVSLYVSEEILHKTIDDMGKIRVLIILVYLSLAMEINEMRKEK